MRKALSTKDMSLLDRSVDRRRPRWVNRSSVRIVMCCTVIAPMLEPVWLGADQVRMQNGDHYLGEVVSLGTNTLVLKSDVLGTVQLPREKVALITLGSSVATNVQPVASAPNNPAGVATAPLTNGTVDLSASLRQLGANTNFIQQVQAQFLGAAGP